MKLPFVIREQSISHSEIILSWTNVILLFYCCSSYADPFIDSIIATLSYNFASTAISHYRLKYSIQRTNNKDPFVNKQINKQKNTVDWIVWVGEREKNQNCLWSTKRKSSSVLTLTKWKIKQAAFGWTWTWTMCYNIILLFW